MCIHYVECEDNGINSMIKLHSVNTSYLAQNSSPLVFSAHKEENYKNSSFLRYARAIGFTYLTYMCM